VPLFRKAIWGRKGVILFCHVAPEPKQFFLLQGCDHNDYRPALVRTGFQVAIHALPWIVVLAVIIFGVPAVEARFADLKFKVPWMTVLLLDISNFFIEFWFLLAFLIVILLAVDAPVSFYLRLRSRIRRLEQWVAGLSKETESVERLRRPDPLRGST
jgi:hypothetical protein